MFWEKQMMLSLCQPERYRGHVGAAAGGSERISEQGIPDFYRYVVTSAVEVEGKGEEIPAVETFVLDGFFR